MADNKEKTAARDGENAEKKGGIKALLAKRRLRHGSGEHDNSVVEQGLDPKSCW